MSNEDPSAPVGAGPPRRPPRQGVGGSPVGSTLSIVLAVVAVVVGFLILRNITDDGGSGAEAPSDSTVGDTTGSTFAPAPPSSTEPPLVTEGATVIVANASGVPQSAAGMTSELEAVGFTMGTPTNATATGQEASVVYYDPANAAAKDVADSVARVMGGLAVETVPSPIPIEGGSLNGAGVLVMLGKNEAGKTLEEITGADEPTDTLVTSPNVSGQTNTGTTSPD